ncbi:uncharacterized protein KZ484_005093 [Pholidichthys leucotaenia]
MAAVKAVLESCDPDLLDPCGDLEQDCAAKSAGMVVFLTEKRRVQKVLWRQLFVLDSMMTLLEGLTSAQQLMTQPCPSKPESDAYDRWQALKAESRSLEEETETLLRSLQENVQQIHSKRQKLTQLVQQLHSKKQQHDQLEESLLKAQNALRSCDHQLSRVRVEMEAVVGQLVSWQELRDDLQAHVSASQDVMQFSLLTFNQSELCVELRLCPSSNLSSTASTDLEPLKLSVTWSHDDRFRLLVNNGNVGLAEDCLWGRRDELSTALLKVMHCYIGQAELLSEIQALRTSFAIDWHPTQRLLIYLKSASLVCHLEVEEGYPSAGCTRLLSVRQDGQPVDTSGLKPPRTNLSLTNWLVFLCSSPLL